MEKFPVFRFCSGEKHTQSKSENILNVRYALGEFSKDRSKRWNVSIEFLYIILFGIISHLYYRTEKKKNTLEFLFRAIRKQQVHFYPPTNTGTTRNLININQWQWTLLKIFRSSYHRCIVVRNSNNKTIFLLLAYCKKWKTKKTVIPRIELFAVVLIMYKCTRSSMLYYSIALCTYGTLLLLLVCKS